MSGTLSPDEISEQATESPDSPLRGRSRRWVAWQAWAEKHRWLAVVVGGSVFVALIVIIMSVRAIADFTAKNPGVTIDDALASLDAGDYDKATESAERIRCCEGASPEDLGGSMFVLGMAAAAQADDAWNARDRQRLYLLAARYLEEARDRGFPEDRREQGLFVLGRCLHESGQFAQAVLPLEEAFSASESPNSEIYRLLSSACFQQPRPDVPRALTYVRKYLENQEISADERARGQLQQARLLLAQGELEACRRVLLAISPAADVHADALVIRGQLTLDEADRIAHESTGTAEATEARTKERYRQAIRLFRQAEGRDTKRGRASAASSYLIGVALTKLHDYEAALTQLSRTRKIYAESPTGLAAGLEEAGVLLRLGRYGESVAAFRRTLRDVPSADRYQNPWHSLDEFRGRVTQAYQQLLEGGEFEGAVNLTRDMTPLLPNDECTQLRSEAYCLWAESLFDRANDVAAGEAAGLRFEARAKLRKAGRTYAVLARLHITERAYVDDLWNSAESYLRGHDYENAVRMFREYVKNESRHRRPQALVGIGDALLSLGRPDEALEGLQECIEFHANDPASFRARILGSAAYVDKGELDRAKKLLLDNVHHAALTPDSKEWRDSLFALGKISYVQGRAHATKSFEAGAHVANSTVSEKQLEQLEKGNASFRDAIHRLEEFVARYPGAEQVVEARYMIANAYWQSARLPRSKLAAATIDATRVKLNKEIQQTLGSALTEFGQLQELLNGRQDAGDLAEYEQKALRNAYFAQGGVLFDWATVDDDPRRFEEAIQKYSSATNRYQHEPESLQAFVQIADCYRQLGRHAEARATIMQAQMVLSRMPEDAPYADATGYGREEWDSLLGLFATM